MLDPILDFADIERPALPTAAVVHWNGVDLPEALKALEKGSYVLVALDEPPDTTPEPGDR